jgi:hypothetical protein
MIDAAVFITTGQATGSLQLEKAYAADSIEP